jgi:hypothetical protein
MIEDARVAEATSAVAEPVLDEDERSMRILEWALAALALIAAFGLAFLR